MINMLQDSLLFQIPSTLLGVIPALIMGLFWFLGMIFGTGGND
jgi:hypothetical protein